MRKFLLLGLALAAASFLPGTALAHAMLERAEPAVGATVEKAPKAVRLHFSKKLDAAASRLRVENASGKRVDRGDKRLDPGDPAELEVSLPDIPPGRYKVIWRAVSKDTHVTHGDFSFTVGR